jgi:Zn-dependent peptidase ImmA (M78 family)
MNHKRTRPRTVKVFGEKFKIKYLHPDDCDDLDGAHGIMCLNEREIVINNTLPLDQMRRTLIHEIAHAILGVSGISEKLNPAVEEAICVALEAGVSAFKVSNRLHG